MMEESSNTREALREELRELRARLWELERLVRNQAAIEEDLPADTFDVLTFRVADERAALWLGDVREVLPVAETLPLPEAPPWVAGLLDIGSQTIVVLDVAARFRRAARKVELSDLVVVCRAVPRDVGLIVQEVFDVTQVHANQLSPPADEVPHASYLRGTLRVDDGQVLMLSLARLLDASDVPQTEEADE